MITDIFQEWEAIESFHEPVMRNAYLKVTIQISHFIYRNRLFGNCSTFPTLTVDLFCPLADTDYYYGDLGTSS